MSTEDRLRDALHGEAREVQPRDGWQAIEARLNERPSMNRFRILSAAAAAVLVGVAAVAVLNQGDDTTPVVTNPDPTTTQSLTTSTTRPSTTTVATAVELGPHLGILWSTSAATPRDVAMKFARDFLNMPNPSVGPYQAGDSRSGELVIHPKPTGSLATTLSLRQYDGQWYVVAAESANLELEVPASNARIASPVRLTGRSVSFEGQVQVAVLRYDTTLRCTVPTDSCGSDPGVFANTYFTGNGTEKAPFDTTVTFDGADGEYGYVVLWTTSAEDGTVSEATVRLVRFR